MLSLRSIRALVSLALIAAFGGTEARSAESGIPVSLSLTLATDALIETVDACSGKGYKVAVTIVDTDGIVKLEGRGDGSPIHSQRFSFRKAYTIVSMGPMFGVDSGGALVAHLRDFPSGLANLQAGATDLLFIPGSALIKSAGATIGAIGVSGTPQSTEDEACALAGLAKIRSRL
jgi:uncharacterized protein GlcG (DUF336 family)